MSHQNLTAFTQTEQACRDELSQAVVDIDSFKQSRQRCSLSGCHGMCCNEGAQLSEPDAEIIQKLVEEESEFFKSLGLDLPKEVIIDFEEYENFPIDKWEWKGLGSIKKTALKDRPFSTLIPDYPKHFQNKACVFLTDDSRCGLQELSKAKGLNSWYYKPFTCWLFPVFVGPVDNQIKISLPSPETEPWYLPDADYAGFFTQVLCGKHAECGKIGYILLQEELKFLSEIVGRNFLQEIETSLANEI